MLDLDRKLAELFHFGDFRPGQREVITRLLNHEHTLAVLPTGSGKSLCYQLAAQILPGTSIVISPLIALMQDQVDALNRQGFTNVTSLSSALSGGEIGARYGQMERGAFKLIYIAPERTDSPRFQQFIRNASIDLIVIDEAHCISSWGHDFRPHYRNLSKRIPELKKGTVLALTATATREVQQDIISTLGLAMGKVLGNFDRPNLRLEVLKINRGEEKNRSLLELIKQERDSVIVYASSRKETREAFELIQNEGLSVALYHAGLTAQERISAQHAFLQNRVQTIVATVAFGMGIDKPDIRRIIHYNIPGSLESYYQEVGRAGRDGQPSICTLLYSQKDVRIQRFFVDQSFPEEGQIFALYNNIRRVHPIPLSVSDLATATNYGDTTVNAALQILYEQGFVSLTPGGKYELIDAGTLRPTVDFTSYHQRRDRDNARLRRMISYTGNYVCRRAQILSYFGQKFRPPCENCDVCKGSAKVSVSVITPPSTASSESDRVARLILGCVAEMNGRFGRTLIGDLLAGSKRKKIHETGLHHSRAYGLLIPYKASLIHEWIKELIASGLLFTTAEEYPRLKLTPGGVKALQETEFIALSGFKRSPARLESQPKEAPEDVSLQIELFRQGGPPPDTNRLFDALQNAEAISPAVVVLVIHAIGELKIREASGLLAKILSSANANLVIAAGQALGKLDAKETIPQILALTKNPSSNVRRSAVRALGLMQARQARSELQRLVETDDSDYVRLSARAALLRIGS